MTDIIVPFRESKYIVFSSLFFLYPTYTAIKRELYFYACLLFLTSVFSINYWRHATYSWRRNLDLIWAKFIFTLFISYGIYYIRDPFTMFIFYYNIHLLVYCYNQACKYHEQKNICWIIFHVLFHMFSMIDLNIVVITLPNNQRNLLSY
jgi:hypothetical protein